MRKRALGVVAGLSLLLGIICVAQWLRKNHWKAHLSTEIHLGIRRLSAEELAVPGNRIMDWEWGLGGMYFRKDLAILWNDNPSASQVNETRNEHGWVRTGNGVPIVAFGIPYWLIVPLTLIAPAAWLRRFQAQRRRQRRAQMGLCIECGYDLRETPDRCPECGAIPDEARA